LAAAQGPLLTPDASQELLPAAKAFPATAVAIDDQTVAVRFELPQGYYLYRDKLRFSFGGDVEPPLAIGLPPGTVIDDEFFGRVVTYRGGVEVRLTMQEPRGGQSVPLVVDSQGCADLGVCYPPYRQRFSVSFPTGGAPGQQGR
jgi:thiol:disulfide interchange protein DsbD